MKPFTSTAFDKSMLRVSKSNSYHVTLYVDGSLSTYQVYADDREEAQEKVIQVIEQVQRVHGEIVSIKLIKEWS